MSMEVNVSITTLKQTQLCGHEFSVYGTAEEPMFRAQEVATIIKHSNITKMLEMVDEDEKGVNQLLTPGGTQQVWFVTEDGLYEILMQSRRPIAKQFKSAVKSILKEIRKTGGYIATTADMTDDEIIQRAILLASNKIKEREERIKSLEAETREKDLLIQDMKKGADYLNNILRSNGTVTTTQVAQDYGMSAKAFNGKLADMRIQHKVGGQWILYAPYLGKGYVHSETINLTHRDGSPYSRMITKWTQRGRLFLYDALKEMGILPTIERAYA